MKVLVCGSRHWCEIGEGEIARQIALSGATVIIEGGARGADRIARLVAEKLGLEVVTFDADWEKHGKAAGPIRNQQMLDEGKPDLVLAFPLRGSIGTYDMIRRARRAGVRVEVFGAGEATVAKAKGE